MPLKFEKQRFSKRFPEIESIFLVYHEPQTIPRRPMQSLDFASRHRGTGAALVLPDGRFWIGTSLCSPKDQFIKAIGRAKAKGRAIQARQSGTSTGLVDLHQEDCVSTIIRHIKEQIETDRQRIYNNK